MSYELLPEPTEKTDADRAMARIIETAMCMTPEQIREWMSEHTEEMGSPFGVITIVVNPFLKDDHIQIQ